MGGPDDPAGCQPGARDGRERIRGVCGVLSMSQSTIDLPAVGAQQERWVSIDIPGVPVPGHSSRDYRTVVARSMAGGNPGGMGSSIAGVVPGGGHAGFTAVNPTFSASIRPTRRGAEWISARDKLVMLIYGTGVAGALMYISQHLPRGPIYHYIILDSVDIYFSIIHN